MTSFEEKASGTSAEQRKYKRSHGTSGAYAIFTTADEGTILGQIMDISLGGAGVRYISTRAVGKGYSNVKICGTNGGVMHLERVSCKVVYDTELPDICLKTLQTRRCGVEFSQLPEEFKARLEQFIKHYTIGDL